MNPMDAHDAIASISGISGEDFDPASVVDAVNWFVDGGASEASELLESALSGSMNADFETKAIFVTRMLFVPRNADEPIPPPHLGLPDTGIVSNRTHSPAWPLLVCCDLPFLPVGSFHIGGIGPGARGYLREVQKLGVSRGRPLKPSRAGPTAAQTLLHGPAWHFVVPPDHRTYAAKLIRVQAAAALQSNIDRGIREDLLSDDGQRSETAWQKLLANSER